MKRLILLLFLCFSLNASMFASLAAAETSNVHHVVLLWLKEPGNLQAIHKITAVSHSFAAIPGVLSVKIGTGMQSERAIVDDSFDIGMIFTFANRQAMHAYLNHPVHKRSVDHMIQPLVRKIIVYDIQE
ncbi:MAG: Dabb family protein [Mariprofundaceae bacterium]